MQNSYSDESKKLLFHEWFRKIAANFIYPLDST